MKDDRHTSPCRSDPAGVFRLWHSTRKAHLKGTGYKKIGICGVSAGSNMALSAAARIPDITLTIATTPMDWVYWGYYHDGMDGASERPAEGESSLTWRGKSLPCMSPPWGHPDYWDQIRKESKRRGDRIAGLDFHHLAEEKHSLTEEIMIPIERMDHRDLEGRFFGGHICLNPV